MSSRGLEQGSGFGLALHRCIGCAVNAVPDPLHRPCPASGSLALCLEGRTAQQQLVSQDAAAPDIHRQAVRCISGARLGSLSGHGAAPFIRQAHYLVGEDEAEETVRGGRRI